MTDAEQEAYERGKREARCAADEVAEMASRFAHQKGWNEACDAAVAKIKEIQELHLKNAGQMRWSNQETLAQMHEIRAEAVGNLTAEIEWLMKNN